MSLPGPLALQAFFQAFPNPSLFSPRISKEFFGGFVGFQGFAIDANPKCRPPNFFAPSPPKNAFAPRSTDEADGAFESNLTRLTFFRKKNWRPASPARDMRSGCDRAADFGELRAWRNHAISSFARECVNATNGTKWGAPRCWFLCLQVGLAPEDFAPRWHYLGRGTFFCSATPASHCWA